MDEIEWIIHEINVEIDEALHRIELETVYNKNNPEVHYHAAEKYNCSLISCGGTSPLWILKHTLQQALKQLNDTYPTSPLNELNEGG